MITPEIEAAIKNISRAEAEEVYRTLGTRFGVPETPRHTHDGKDSEPILESSLRERIEYIHVAVEDTRAIDVDDYGHFWIAPYACVVLEAVEMHKVAGSDGGAVTLQVEKVGNGVAVGSGVDLLTTPFNLKGTANTLQSSSIVSTSTSGVRDATMKIGDRLALLPTGTLTSLRTVIVRVTVQH